MHPGAEEDEAEHITRAAAQRGLGQRPGLRKLSAVMWAGFLGATCTTAATLLTPDAWLEPPLGFDRLALIFVASFALALVPAVAVAMLCHPGRGGFDEQEADDAR